MQKPDYLFETSWEICNKVGGIYTVIASKAKSIKKQLGDKYILIGPDNWKGVTENPEFEADEELFSDWILKAKSQGLNVRAGHWKIEARPIVLLIDYTPFFAQKDQIFARFWEDYKLDSLSGGWDYIEPALFGYAAGKVIENFHQYYLGPYHKSVAHFHEWMTGAGVLHLEKNLPSIGTVFTTHATVLGRSISGNGQELYEYLESYQADVKASELRVVAKNSLEQRAAQVADSLTTVSEITSRECEQFLGRVPDVITINGFDKSFVPVPDQYQKQREKSREIILSVASRLIGKKLPEDTFILLNSGRYEFKNKGVDIFLDAVGNLKDRDSSREVLGIVALPAGTIGPVPQLVGLSQEPLPERDKFITHHFSHMDHDPVIERILKNEIYNIPEQNTHLIFVPCYLDGRDGVFNLDYYQFLLGSDYTVFPSYYEPWGYTPLESVAFGIPTITTQYAGFGKWVQENFSPEQEAVMILDRSPEKEKQLPLGIASIVDKYLAQGKPESIRQQAAEIADEAEWDKLAPNYFRAYDIALSSSGDRKTKLIHSSGQISFEVEPPAPQAEPNWKKILVKNVFPEELEPLKELLMNIWWTWNDEATALVESIGVGKLQTNNPLKRIENLSVSEMKGLIADKDFMGRLQKIHKEFKEYLSRPKADNPGQVAYFSMEYGLHSSIKMYSGGLGVLAGDYLKQASDSNKDLVAVGLLYRFGYFKQQMNTSGEQIAVNVPLKFTQMPLTPVRDEDEKWMYINLAFPGRLVTAKIWMLMVGTVPLYLLDTDIEQNREEDRTITHHLYGGDREHRLKQELLLGFGGIRLLKKLKLEPRVFHSNEGHSAFIGIERIRQLIDFEHLDFPSAVEVVRASTLFTTHTPVPAGHDTFTEDLIRVYLGHYPDHLGIDWDSFIGLGKFNPANRKEEFSMSVLATNLSQRVNGVSRIHGKVSRDMFQPLYPSYFAEELHIGYVTNGVHYPTWTDEVWKKTYRELFGEQFEKEQYDQSHWEKIYSLPDEKIWENRLAVKRKLIGKVLERIENNASYYQTNPKLLVKLQKTLTENALVIGFARRFATYKRATLLFKNRERLAKLVNQENRPVVFLFAGKAHPRDLAGQHLIREIIEISRQPEFEGRILFLENYDMELGKLLTSGVDVWLNTPTRPLEASGTSGQKAILNGSLNFSVLDGWWAEGYKENAGWALEERKRYDDQEAQNQLDAAKIYDKLENEIIPSFFQTGPNGLPDTWISYIKNNIAWICPQFTMQRMLDDYYRDYYQPLFDNNHTFTRNGFENAYRLSEWKRKVLSWWNEIRVNNMKIPDTNRGPIDIQQNFEAEVKISIPGLDMKDIGIEVVFGHKTSEERFVIKQVEQLKPVRFEGDVATFACIFPMQFAGVHDYAFRVYPRHELLSSRMDFPIVKWL